MLYLRYLTFFMVILGFFLLRPYHLQNTGLMYSGDDEGYLAHATSLVYFQFPSYKNENNPYKSALPLSSVGPGVLASPFVFVGSLVDRILDNPIIKKRTKESIYTSWTLFGFVIATIFYFYFAFLLLYKGLAYHFSYKVSFFSVLCMIFLQIFGLYVFRRPVFSHIYEFFLHSIFIYFLLKDVKNGFLDNRSNQFNFFLGILVGLVALVRYNNIFIALAWPVILFGFRSGNFEFKKYLKKFIIIYIAAFLVIFLFKIFPMIYNHTPEGYIGGASVTILNVNLISTFKRLWNVFFGIDFGIIFTAPFAFIGLIFAFLNENIFRKRVVLLLVLLLINLFFTVTWPATIQGCWYGYRYFLFSLIPIVLIPFAFAIKQFLEYFKNKFFIFFLAIIAVIPVISMLSFEGNNTTLNLTLVEKIGWINPTYQLEIWKMFLLHPLELIIVLLKGVFLYLLYLFAYFFNFGNRFPSIIFEKYPIFSISILIKVFIIFILPFIFYYLVKKLEFLDKSDY